MSPDPPGLYTVTVGLGYATDVQSELVTGFCGATMRPHVALAVHLGGVRSVKIACSKYCGTLDGEEARSVYQGRSTG